VFGPLRFVIAIAISYISHCEYKTITMLLIERILIYILIRILLIDSDQLDCSIKVLTSRIAGTGERERERERIWLR